MNHRHYFVLLTTLFICISSSAQMYVWKNGEIIFRIDNDTADSITFEKPYGTLEKYSFSVGDGKRVRFSRGNLQYCDMYYEWRFAENQYDIIGASNSNIGEMYDGWIDLFGWGTFGYCFTLSNGKEECHNVYETSTDYRDYLIKGDWRNGLAGENELADWGIANWKYIINGDDIEWRTLTSSEWRYLLTERADATHKFALATVNGQKGLIILADEWEHAPEGLSFYTSTSKGLTYQTGYYEDEGYIIDHFTDNTYTKEEWARMEKAGALFLPAAGQRRGTTVQNLNGSQTFGRYYSTTPTSDEREGNVYSLSFYMSGVTPTSEFSRIWGASVRLVHDIE